MVSAPSNGRGSSLTLSLSTVEVIMMMTICAGIRRRRRRHRAVGSRVIAIFPLSFVLFIPIGYDTHNPFFIRPAHLVASYIDRPGPPTPHATPRLLLPPTSATIDDTPHHMEPWRIHSILGLSPSAKQGFRQHRHRRRSRCQMIQFTWWGRGRTTKTSSTRFFTKRLQ